MHSTSRVEVDGWYTVACGRPPAKESVVPMRSVAAPVCADVAVKTIVTGLLTLLKTAMGKSVSDEEPTV